MFYTLVFWLCMIVLLLGWLLVALAAWLILYHLQLAILAAAAILFAVYVRRRRGGTLAGPR